MQDVLSYQDRYGVRVNVVFLVALVKTCWCLFNKSCEPFFLFDVRRVLEMIVLYMLCSAWAHY